MSIKEDINLLTEPKAVSKNLPANVVRPPIGKKQGRASFSSSDSAGQGISSPLTEESRNTVFLNVFDQFMVWSVNVEVVTSITMVDASGNTVVFNYDDPTAV